MEQYDIPFFQKSSLKPIIYFLELFFILLLAAVAVLFFVWIDKDEPIIEILVGIFFAALDIFFVYIFITIGVLKKFYVNLTEEYIKFSTPYSTKFAYWRDIAEVFLYTHSNNISVCFLLKKDIKDKTKRSISNNLNLALGAPPSSFQVPMNFFSGIDINKFLYTVQALMEKNEVKDEYLYDSFEEEADNNIIKAALAALCSSIIIGILYGLSIHWLDKNYIAIPIFTSIIIIAVFNKFYIEKSFNIAVRLLVGLFCFIQVPIGPIFNIMISLSLNFNVSSFFVYC